MIRPSWQVREASADDLPAIESLVESVDGDAQLLDEGQFVVAESENGTILGCGRLRPYPEFCEVASLAVDQDRRANGVGRAIIARLLELYTGDVYLICEDHVMNFFSHFGFQPVPVEDMPAGLEPKWQHYDSQTGSMNVMLLERSRQA